MDECLGLSKKPDGSVVLPVAYLVCNQTPPVGDTPSLMSFEEVETLFHVDIKHQLYDQIDKVRNTSSIVSSNTSTIAI